MNLYCLIDDQTGDYIEDVIYEQKVITDDDGIETIEPVPDNLVSIKPSGLYKPRWNGKEWVESLSGADLLTEKKSIMRAQVADQFETDMLLLADGYSSLERETWAQQKAESVLHLSDSGAQTPMLSAIASERGIAVSELATKVNLNSIEFSIKSGAAVGKLKESIKKLEAATTLEELNSIVS